MIVRELFAKLGIALDGGSFSKAQKALEDVKKKAATVGDQGLLGGAQETLGSLKQIAAVGVSLYALEKGVSVVRDIVTEFTELATRLDRVAPLLLSTAQQLQGWEHSAGRAGVGAGQLQGILSGLADKMYATTLGSAEAVMAFGRMGVSIREAFGRFKEPAKILDEVLQRAAKFKGDPIILMGRLKALGGGIHELYTYYRDLPGGIAAARAEVREFGAELSSTDINAAKGFRVELSRATLVWQGLKNAIAGPVLEILHNTLREFVEWAKAEGRGGTDFLRSAFESLKKAQPFLLQLLKLLYRMAPLFGWLAEGAAALAHVLGTLGNAISYLAQYVGGLETVAIALGIALMAAFAPVTSIVLALLLVFEDFLVYQRGGISLIGRAEAAIKNWWSSVDEGAQQGGSSTQAFMTALKALVTGDFVKAWEAGIEAVTRLFDALFQHVKDEIVNIAKAIPATLGTLLRGPEQIAHKLGFGQGDIQQQLEDAEEARVEAARVRTSRESIRFGTGERPLYGPEQNPEAYPTQVKINASQLQTVAGIVAGQLSKTAAQQAAVIFGEALQKELVHLQDPSHGWTSQ